MTPPTLSGPPRYARGYDAERALQAALQKIYPGAWVERVHASKGTFDVLASYPWGTYLIQCKRTKRPIKTMKGINGRFKNDLAKIRGVPTPDRVHPWIVLYTDRQDGAPRGTWRIFEVLSDGSLFEVPKLGDLARVLPVALGIQGGLPLQEESA